MDERHIEILQEVHEIFLAEGVKSVNMDTIARNLGISKKTLYKYCSDKNDLVNQTIKHACLVDHKDILNIVKISSNAIEEVLMISQIVKARFSKLKPNFFLDLMKYHPEALQELSSHQNTLVLECVVDNIERGKNEGLYREDMDTDVVAGLYVMQITSLFQHEIFEKMNKTWREIAPQMFFYHIHGMASMKGLEYLKTIEEKFDNF
jgi:TetR/AcrR family transcriptional regulator, cholesterol catabolism regulator